MTKEAVIAHLEETVAAEQQVIREQHDVLTAANPGLERFQRVLDSMVSTEDFDVKPYWPRPSLHLLRRAFTDIGQVGREHGADLQFIGEHVLPLTGLAPGESVKDIVLTSTGSRDTCQKAEGFFEDAREQVEDGLSRGQQAVAVYDDGAGNPLIFRKEQEFSNGLTLAPLSAGALTLPAGTIAAVASARIHRSHATGLRADGGFGMTVYRASGELDAIPVRASAWAYDEPLDRALFACEGPLSAPEEITFDEEKAALLTGTALEDFRASAHRLMDLCIPAVEKPSLS